MSIKRTEKKLEKVVDKSKNLEIISASRSLSGKHSEKNRSRPQNFSGRISLAELQSQSDKNKQETPERAQRLNDNFETPKKPSKFNPENLASQDKTKNKPAQTPSKYARNHTPDHWTPSKYLRTQTIKDDILIDARPKKDNLLTIEDKEYIIEHLTRNSRLQSSNITPNRTRIQSISKGTGLDAEPSPENPKSRVRTLSKNSEKSTKIIPEETIEKKVKRGYPNILKYLDDPNYVNKPQQAPKSRVKRRHRKSEAKDATSKSKDADEKKVRKKRRQEKRRGVRTGSTDTPNDIEVHNEEPDYNPFRTSLNKDDVKRHWPGSEKNVQILKFNKGFTIRGAKIDPTAKITMSPLVKNRFSCFGSPMKPIGDI